jgi:hypothetical protein
MRLLTIVAIVGFIVMVGCGCGGSNSGATSTKTPEQVTKAFWIGMKNANAETTWSLMSKKMQSALTKGDKAAWVKYLKQFDIKAVEVGKATISDDTATIPVKLTVYTGESAPVEAPLDVQVSLIKEGSIWKMYNYMVPADM